MESGHRSATAGRIATAPGRRTGSPAARATSCGPRQPPATRRQSRARSRADRRELVELEADAFDVRREGVAVEAEHVERVVEQDLLGILGRDTRVRDEP